MRFAGTQGIVEPEKLRDDFFNAAKLLIAMTFAAKSLFGPGKGRRRLVLRPLRGHII